MTLHVRFWGTRGSVPSPGPRTVRYGGNTPCVEVRTASGGMLVLDAGTGLRELGLALDARLGGPPDAVDIFVTHVHWDHVQGLPFFAPLYRHGSRLRLWGPDSAEAPFGEAIRALIAPPSFPVVLDEAGARLEFAAPPSAPVVVAGCEVTSIAVRHPGGAVGYRVREPGAPHAGLVYVPDNELRGGTVAESDERREALVRFAHRARVLVHDTTYTAEEYGRRNGWGHSTYADAVELAIESRAERLLLFHHNPDRTDEELDRRVEECSALAVRRGAQLEIIGAAEGMELTI